MSRQYLLCHNAVSVTTSVRFAALSTGLAASFLILTACSSLPSDSTVIFPEASVTDAAACASLPNPTDASAPLLPTGSTTPASVDPVWAHISFVPFKLESQYTLMECEPPRTAGAGRVSGLPVIRVDADSSASMFQTPVSIQVTETTRIQWKWLLSGVSGSVDNRRAKTEDSPLRVVLAFDGDRSTLPEDEQSFLNQMDWLTGRKAPYATLMYVLGSGAKNGEIVSSTHTDTIRLKIVQQAGDRSLHNHWQAFNRLVYKDYMDAFGQAPGRLIGVGVMGDMDNTKHKSRAYVSNITVDGRVLIQPLAASGKR